MLGQLDPQGMCSKVYSSALMFKGVNVELQFQGLRSMRLRCEPRSFDAGADR